MAKLWKGLVLMVMVLSLANGFYGLAFGCAVYMLIMASEF